jgi:hypothetical protein
MVLLLLLWLLLVLLLLLTRYYLSPKYTVIKVRPDQKRIVPIQNVLSKGFEAYCKEQIPTLEPPSGSSVVNWLGSRFGIGSAEGYTTIHPRKTDACVRACFFCQSYTHYNARFYSRFFKSHATIYVHMSSSRTMGDLAGPGRLNAHRFYTREQAVGGSKNSDDVVSTLFDRLHGSTSTDTKPPIYRTGYDDDGRISGDPFAAPAVPALPVVTLPVPMLPVPAPVLTPAAAPLAALAAVPVPMLPVPAPVLTPAAAPLAALAAVPVLAAPVAVPVHAPAAALVVRASGRTRAPPRARSGD